MKNLMINRACLFIFFYVFIDISIAQDLIDRNRCAIDRTAIQIKTGSVTGAYYPAGTAIAKVLAEVKGLSSIVCESSGSVENLESLRDGATQLAIIQSDVLFRQSKDVEQGASYTIGALGALFPEYIQILIRKRDKSPINSLLKLANKTIYIGTPGSGTYSNAKEILDFVDLVEGEESHQYKIDTDSKNIEVAKKKLKTGLIDAIFDTSGSLHISDPEIAILGLSTELAESLTDAMPYYSMQPYETGFRPTHILYVRSVLVSLQDTGKSEFGAISNELAFEVTQAVYDNWYRIESQLPNDIDLFQRGLMARKVSLDLHPGARRFYIEQGVLSDFNYKYKLALLALSLIAVIIIVYQGLMSWRVTRNCLNLPFIAWLQDQRWFKAIWSKLLWATTSHGWLMAIWIFFAVLAWDVYIIVSQESSWAHEFDLEDPFAGRTILDILFWLLTFAVTGFNQDIFPNSPLAKFSAVIIPVFAVIGALFMIIHQSIQKDRRTERSMRGELPIKAKGHILICGWNDRVPAIIANLISEFAPVKRLKIVVLAEVDKEKPFQKLGFDPSHVSYYRGISSSLEDLASVCMRDSDCAIVVADDNKVKRGNIRSILTVAALRHVKPNKENYKIAAEVFYRDNLKYFTDNGANALICLDSYSVRFISHAILNPGVSDLILDVLSFDPPFKIEEISANKLDIINKKYRECIEDLRENNILLLGAYKKQERTAHKPFELEFRKDNCPYVINPAIGSKEDITISANDSLIVIKKVANKKQKERACLQKKQLDAVKPEDEYILIVGKTKRAKEIAFEIATNVKKIVYLKIEETETETETETKHQNFSILRYSNVLDALRSKELQADKITRILVLSSDHQNTNFDDSIYHDDETLHFVTAISNIFSTNLKLDLPHIAAEIRNLKNKDLFEQLNIKQVIPTNKLVELNLSRMVFHHGRVSGLLLKSMDNDKSNRKARIKKNDAKTLSKSIAIDLIGKNYDFILLNALDKGIQLIGIETTDSNNKKKLIINPQAGHPDAEVCLKETDCLFYFERPMQTGSPADLTTAQYSPDKIDTPI